MDHCKGNSHVACIGNRTNCIHRLSILRGIERWYCIIGEDLQSTRELNRGSNKTE